MPVTFTTDLPDVGSLSLDASVAEQLGVYWDDPLNNGEYRLEYRDDDPDGNHPPYQHEATIAHDAATEHIIQNILGGEQYSVRVRTQTAHVTGNWLTADEITKLIASDSLSVSGTSTTSLDLQWTINNDFRGSHQVYRQRDDYEYAGEPADSGRLVGSVADNVSSYTDDTVAPDRPYSYQVRTLTQWQYADSGIVPTETNTAGLEQSPVPARGWYVEVDHPSGQTLTPQVLEQSPVPARGWYVEVDHPSGQTLTPQVLDDVERRPSINAKARAEIPIPRDETWLSDQLDDQPLRVWKDGRQLPIDTLEDREERTDRVILHGTGPAALDNRVTADVDTETAWELAQRLIQDETDLVANVDQPVTNKTNDVVQHADTTGEFEHILQGLSATAPIAIQNGWVDLLQTCFVREGLDDAVFNASTVSDDSFSSGSGSRLQASSDYVEYVFTNEYRIPESAVGIQIRDRFDSAPSVRVLLDGNELSVSDAGTGGGTLAWTDYDSPPSGWGNGWTYGDLEPGEHTLRLEVVTEDSGHYDVDVATVYDNRFSYTFDNAVHEPSGYLDGPQEYPDQVALQFDTHNTVLSVRAGAADVTMNDTSGSQYVAISNDGTNWIRANNSETVSGDFTDPTGEITLEVGLSRYGAVRNETPRYGYQGQSIDVMSLEADLDDTPLVIDQSFDGDLEDILAEIAGEHSIWEVSRDDATGELSIEWCQPGQRSAGRDLDVVDYSVRKVSSNIQRAIVYGASRSVRDEAWMANVGNAVALEEPDAEEYLVSGSIRVYDSNGVIYDQGTDYAVDRRAATITALSGGALTDGTEYLVDYDYKIAGVYEGGGYSGDPREEEVRSIPELTSERACALAGKVIVDRGSDPRTEADVQLPPSVPADLSLVEALDLEEMPGKAMAIYELTGSPDGLSLRLGDRNRVADTIQQLEQRAQSLSNRV